jgi:hypothetical protein
MTIHKLLPSLVLIGMASIVYLQRHPATAQVAAERAVSPTLTEAVRSASRLAGVRFSSLLSQLAHESGLQLDARNPASTATGPAQFLEATWLDMLRRHGAAFGLGDAARQIVVRDGKADVADPNLKTALLALRADPHLAAAMAARYLAAVRRDLAKLLARRPSDVEMRMGYLLGAGGAAQLIAAARATPRKPATEILPEAARANATLFHDEAGGPLDAAACVAQIGRLLSAQDAWSAQFEPAPPREHIGDLVHEPAPTG